MSEVDLCLVTHFHLDHCGAVPYLVTHTDFRGRIFMTSATKAVCNLLWLDYARVSKFAAASAAETAAGGSSANTAGNNPTGSNAASGGGISGTAADTAMGKSGITQQQVATSKIGLYGEEDIAAAMHLCQTLEFHEEVEVDDIKFACYGAGHVLGACMFVVEIAGVRVLYTGDYSREDDRHVPRAEIPPVSSIDVLICEATFGIRVHEPREEREAKFLKTVESIVLRGGKCLLPVFALGRAQELLLMLEEHWKANHDTLQHVPIFYCSPISAKSMRVFETFINLCGSKVREAVNRGVNPFDFHYIKNAMRLDNIGSYLYSDEPCVAMAPPGMLQRGISRELFELWAPDALNGIVLTGYAVRGTVADDLRKDMPGGVIRTPEKNVKVNCTVESLTFSAHSDFNQTKSFIEGLQTPNVVLVHGERSEILRLKDKISELRPAMAVFTPEVLQRVLLTFPKDETAFAVGALAAQTSRKLLMADPANNDYCTQLDSSRGDQTPTDFDAILFVEPNSVQPIISAPSEVSEYCDTQKQNIRNILKLSFAAPLGRLEEALRETFEEVEVIKDNLQLRVCNRVDIQISSSTALGNNSAKHDEVTGRATPLQPPLSRGLDGGGAHVSELILEWRTCPVSDLVADSITYIVLETLQDGNTSCHSTAALTECSTKDIRRAPRPNVKRRLCTEATGEYNDSSSTEGQSATYRAATEQKYESVGEMEQTQEFIEVCLTYLRTTYGTVSVRYRRQRKLNSSSCRGGVSRAVMSDNTHGSANSEERTASTLHEERTASTLHEERTASTLHEERTASTLHEEQNTDHYSSDDSAAEPDNELFDTGSTCDTGDTCLTNRYPIVEFYVPSSDMDEARSSV
eukprot:Lankesteria_metandrocarpae@DN3780_c0_g1_i1.p1